MNEPTLILNFVDILIEAGYPALAEDIKEAAERLRDQAEPVEVGDGDHY